MDATIKVAGRGARAEEQSRIAAWRDGDGGRAYPKAAYPREMNERLKLGSATGPLNDRLWVTFTVDEKVRTENRPAVLLEQLSDETLRVPV